MKPKSRALRRTKQQLQLEAMLKQRAMMADINDYIKQEETASPYRPSSYYAKQAIHPEQ